MFTSVAQANAAVIEQIRRARPHWLDVQPASSLISELNEGKTLLHAGPPMRWQEMTGPMKGACVGACLFEGWAKDEAQALAILEQGEVNFIPCHHVNAVGPMGGITSASMPMLVVENVTDGNRAYCNLNEGIGKVMRFGAYGEDVLTRHRWMRDVLMPVLSAALGRMERGIDLTAMMAQGITMGDEFHQRNIASSALLMRALAPQIARLDHDKQHIAEVMDFLSVTDQFFLNLAMAYCKAAMDAGAMIRAGSIVTAMTRNGNMFGIRVSGLGERWFTAPVNTPQGLFFTGFSQEQANPDMGDSAITETFGIGGAAMIAAPGVTRFVGAGGMEAARAVSEEMAEIYLERNMQLQIPGWDFQGACLGLDIRRVVETGITPLINTGIAHKEAGIGQIGAGTVRAPLALAASDPLTAELRQFRHCFQAALNGVKTDWRHWLGKGPGLTPSHDDTLSGMLLAAWYYGALDARSGRPFFACSDNLQLVTTAVSVSYLRYAAQGYFASPLLHFVHALSCPKRTAVAIDSLLALGHTSGADTLLGFWLGQQLLQGKP